MEAGSDVRGRWGGEEPSEIELRGERAEFRTALREEINAARRSASSAGVPLLNGRRIAQVGEAFQYAFVIQNAINAPGDQPADLIVPGRAPVEATVIAVEGLAVTVSVGEDLGDAVAYATLRSDLTLLLRRLISRIEALAEVDNPAGDRLLGQAAPTGSAVSAAVEGLNAEPADAVDSSLGRDTTFIWGPPGTGKTRTIGTIGEQLYRRERSLLLVSHTNAAVDQALLHIARQLGQEMTEGSVLRVGDPVDQRLKEAPELLAATHVKRRTEQLQVRKGMLEAEKAANTARVLELAHLSAMCEWLPEGTRDIQDTRAALNTLVESERLTESARVRVQELRAAMPALDEAAAAAAEALRERGEQALLSASVDGLVAAHERAAAAAEQAEHRRGSEEQALAQSERLEALRVEADGLPELNEQRATAARRHAEHQAAKDAAATAQTELTDAEDLHTRASEANALQRRWRGLPKPEDQEQVVTTRRQTLTKREAAETRAREAARSAQRVLARVEELTTQLDPWRALPRIDAQAAILTETAHAAEAATRAAEDAQAAITRTRARIAELDATLAAFSARHGGGDPDEIIRVAAQRRDQLTAEERGLDERVRADADRREPLAGTIWQWLRALRGWGLAVDVERRGAETMLDELERARAQVAAEVAGLDVGELRRERDECNAAIRRANAEIAEIEEHLKVVEATLIAEARVIATTLTRAYTREPVHARRYDSVVLDEASMAPIPALWAAAALAEHNVILVGDFKQLPPIKHSDHELADKWLGRDVFEASGVLRAYEQGTPPAHFVALHEQFRMHPQISAIPNELIYDSTLRDGPSTTTTARSMASTGVTGDTTRRC